MLQNNLPAFSAKFSLKASVADRRSKSGTGESVGTSLFPKGVTSGLAGGTYALVGVLL